MSGARRYSRPVVPGNRTDVVSRPKSNSAVALRLWRWRMWLEATFGISVLEPWERFLVLGVLIILAALLAIYIPSQLARTSTRMVYYIYGHEQTGRAVAVGLMPEMGSE